ncbi:MAG: hypothetical protein EKK42_10970 [Pseudonocardiaceae bacterium]|nr:MAG: hypothetical protein EKK42_10970 [Pseudonocardiaceae bacterium]
MAKRRIGGAGGGSDPGGKGGGALIAVLVAVVLAAGGATVRYTGTAYASRLDGRTVANAQAEPVARGWAGLALTSVVTDAVG